MTIHPARAGQIRLHFAFACIVVTLALHNPSARSATAAHSDPATIYRGAIQSAYDQMNTAFAEDHIERSAALMTDDYRQMDPHGHILDKAGSRKKFQWERSQIRTIQTQCSIDGIVLAADGLHVQMATHSTGTGFKRVLFVDVSGKFINDLRVNDLWVYTPAGWRLKYRQMLQDDSHCSAG